MKIIPATIALFALGAIASSGNAATIVNGSFETGTNPGAGFTTAGVGSTAITGWTVGGFGVDYIGGLWQASDGVRSIDLSGSSAGSLAQAIDTVIGNVYTVSFDLSGNPDAGPATKTTVVSIGGSLPSVLSYVVSPANSHADMNWQTYTYQFTAFATSSVLTFASADFSPFGPALDNVSILENGGGIGSAVPEPANWAMLLMGFGMIGVASRRRRGVAVSA